RQPRWERWTRRRGKPAATTVRAVNPQHGAHGHQFSVLSQTVLGSVRFLLTTDTTDDHLIPRCQPVLGSAWMLTLEICGKARRNLNSKSSVMSWARATERSGSSVQCSLTTTF